MGLTAEKTIDYDSTLHKAEDAKQNNNYQETIKRYKILAKDDETLYALIGDIYREGRVDVPRDIAEAEKFYSLGSKKGDGYATAKKGELCLERQDYKKAIKLFIKGEGQRVSALAITHLVWMYKQDMLEDNKDAIKLAKYYVDLNW